VAPSCSESVSWHCQGCLCQQGEGDALEGIRQAELHDKVFELSRGFITGTYLKMRISDSKAVFPAPDLTLTMHTVMVSGGFTASFSVFSD